METGKCVSKVSAAVATILIVAASLALTPHYLKESHGVKVSVSDDAQRIYRLEQPGGGVRYKKMNEYTIDVTKAQMSARVDSTVFDLRTMTDSAYSDMYKFSQEVAVAGHSFFAPIVGDIDEDGKAELYGYQKLYSTPDFSIHGMVFRQDSLDIYRLAYSYPDSVLDALSIYDIDEEGVKEIVQRTSSGQSEVFRAPSAGMLPTNPSFGFNPYASTDQMDYPKFGDFDANGKTDVVYYLESTQLSVFISEYDPQKNEMDTVYRFRPPDIYTQGFSVGDFDQDGKTDMVMGSINGKVFVIEAQGVRQYANVWTGNVETYNAYLHMNTNDIDGNGKPEFWVGGDAYYSGLGMTRFTCFESDGVHSYKPVHKLDLVGVFSFFAGNCFAKDIDGDGKEEIFICIDQHVIVLKFTGGPNSHHYEVYYMRINEMADQNSVYHGATLSDLEVNGKDELLITMDQVIANQGRREFTRIYKPTTVDDVHQGDGELPGGFQLFQNYPNPFNSTTLVRFAVPPGSGGRRIRLSVYDLLGREVRALLDEVQGAGEHRVSWDGRDNVGTTVGSGAYLIVMRAENYIKAIKAIYLK